MRVIEEAEVDEFLTELPRTSIDVCEGFLGDRFRCGLGRRCRRGFGASGRLRDRCDTSGWLRTRGARCSSLCLRPRCTWGLRRLRRFRWSAGCGAWCGGFRCWGGRWFGSGCCRCCPRCWDWFGSGSNRTLGHRGTGRLVPVRLGHCGLRTGSSRLWRLRASRWRRSWTGTRSGRLLGIVRAWRSCCHRCQPLFATRAAQPNLGDCRGLEEKKLRKEFMKSPADNATAGAAGYRL